MLNRDYRKLNMDELSQVAGGIRVLCDAGSLEITELIDEACAAPL